MITIHAKNASDFTDNGLGVLEPLSCYLSVTINGAWLLELENPLSDEKIYNDSGNLKIAKDNIIKVTNIPVVSEQTSTYQLFRIYDTVQTLSTIKAIAFPVAMEATYDAVIEELKTDKKTATATLTDIMTYLNNKGVTKYTVTSDYTQSGVSDRQKKGSWKSTNLIAAISGSDDNSIINHWGGEVAYDNYKIIVNGLLGRNDEYEVRVGKNVTGLSVDTDISGVVTRIYPVSEDGVRLKRTVSGNQVSYYDSDGPNGHINDYPYIRGAFISVPLRLVDTTWEGNVHTDTQIKTHDAIEALIEDITNVADELWDSLNAGLPWHNKWYEPAWIQDILNDAIAQCQKNVTENIEHPTWKALIQACIKEGLGVIKNYEIPDFYWELVTGSSDTYCYTNGLRTITDQYAYVDKRFCHFNEAGNYIPSDDVAYMDWIQPKTDNAAKKFGDNQRYYARNTYIYTMNGDHQGGSTFCEYWFDDDGYWDGVSETETSWSWYQSGNNWWFGEEGATESDVNKYAHDCWLYIYDNRGGNGTAGLYYFGSDGYLDDSLTKTNIGWDWREAKQKDKYYFGSTNKNQYSVYLKDQWLKIDGEWRKFTPNGNLTDMKQLKVQFCNLLSTNLASAIEETITHHQNILYDLLYSDMIQYCQELYAAGLDVPVVTVSANLVELSKTTQYEDFAQFEQAHLGNDVQVHDYEHDIHRTERVVGLKYDCIREYNTEVTVGAPNRTWEQLALPGSSNQNVGKKVVIDGKGEGGGYYYTGWQTLTAGEGVEIDANGVIKAFAPVGDSYNGTQVSVTPTLTGGIEVGKIYIDGTPYTLYCTEEGGLKYWIETEHDIYRTGSHPETEISDRYYYDTVKYWQSRSATHMYYGQYDFKRANDYPAIIGNYGTGMVYFVLASEVEHGADWLWGDASQPPVTYQSPATGDGRYIWSGTVTYHGKTYYASIGQYNFEEGDTITTPFASFNTDNSKPYASIVADLLDTAISTVSVNDITGISNQNTVFYFGNGSYANHENVCWITKDGVFHGKGFEVDGEPISGLSKTELYSGSQYTSPINLSESYNGFSFILIETYNSNDKKNLSTLLSVSDLTSGSYVGIDNYLLYTITNTKKLTFHDDFDDTNHSRYIKKIYGLRSGDSEHGGSDNSVLDVNVDGNSVVANRIANIDLTGKQDNLIAGNNITIGSDGKTINATDTDEISELADVSITNLANGQILKWNSTTSKWENVNGGGGGGSTVDIDPTLSSGTKIADYEIDGVAGELYAPTPVTYSAGNNVQINNGVISATDTTYNDYDGSAHGLVAPPSTTGSGRYLKEDGTWDTPSGGGTTVIANPSGTATADLEKLQVGNDIYSIPSGGGASGDSIDLSEIGDWDLFDLTFTESSISVTSGEIYRDTLTIPKLSFNCVGRKLIAQGLAIGGDTATQSHVSLPVAIEMIQDQNNYIHVSFIFKNITNETIIGYGGYLRCVSPKQGASSDEITIYRNGSWATQNYITFAEYLCTETASGIECQGMHAGVVVSSVSNLNNAYSIVMIIESQNGFDYQTGRCYPNSDLDGVISYGTDRITYDNDSVGAGEIEVEIQTSANTEGVFFGGGYGVSTTDYVIKEIKLVPVQKRKYS